VGKDAEFCTVEFGKICSGGNHVLAVTTVYNSNGDVLERKEVAYTTDDVIGFKDKKYAELVSDVLKAKSVKESLGTLEALKTATKPDEKMSLALQVEKKEKAATVAKEGK
jgi:hypothetical protein